MKQEPPGQKGKGTVSVSGNVGDGLCTRNIRLMKSKDGSKLEWGGGHFEGSEGGGTRKRSGYFLN